MSQKFEMARAQSVIASPTLVFLVRADGSIESNLGGGVRYRGLPPEYSAVLENWADGDVGQKAERAKFFQSKREFDRVFYKHLSRAVSVDELEQSVAPLIRDYQKVTSDSERKLGQEVAFARQLLVRCIEPMDDIHEKVDDDTWAKLSSRLFAIERDAYQSLLRHVPANERQLFDELLFKKIYRPHPLPSLLHDQLSQERAFADTNIKYLYEGFRLTDGCRIVRTKNAGGVLPSEMWIRDFAQLVGNLALEPDRARVVASEIFRFLRRPRSGSDREKRDDEAKMARKSLWNHLTAEERAAMSKVLFASSIRRHGILSWQNFGIAPPDELKPIFRPESIKAIRSAAPAVANQICKSVNRLVVEMMVTVGAQDPPPTQLEELEFPIPLELTLVHHREAIQP